MSQPSDATLKSPAMPVGKLTLRKRLIFSIITVCLFCLALELLSFVANKVLDHWLPNRELRVFPAFFDDHSNHISDNLLFWKLPANKSFYWQGVLIKTNAFGLRDDRFSLSKPAREIRILCIGESGTFGAYVPQYATYSEVLERELNKRYQQRGVRFQVINAGISSYTSSQGLYYLKYHGLQFQPDILLVYYLWNDTLETYFELSLMAPKEADKRLEDAIRPRITDRQMLRRREVLNNAALRTLAHTSSYQLAERIALLIQMESRSDEQDEQTEHLRVTAEERAANFREMSEAMKSAAGETVFMVPLYAPADDVLSALKATEVVVDAHEFLAQRLGSSANPSDRDAFFVRQDPLHPSVRGHQLIVEAVMADQRFVETVEARIEDVLAAP